MTFSEFTKKCRDCGQLIKFRSDVRSLNGSLKPLEISGTERHACPNSSWQRRENAAKEEQNQGGFLTDERLVLDAIARIADINNRLQTCQLRILRESKDGQQHF